MTPERLRECLESLGWWAPELAETLGADLRSVQRWVSGKNAMPDIVGEWLEAVVKHDEENLVLHPPPDKSAWWPRKRAKPPG